MTLAEFMASGFIVAILLELLPALVVLWVTGLWTLVVGIADAYVRYVDWCIDRDAHVVRARIVRIPCLWEVP